MKRTTFLITLVVLLLLAGSALAMESDNYRLDWFTPMTGNGGDEISSDHHVANFTVGQTVIGDFSGTNYDSCLGYWCSGAAEYRIYLPLVLRNL